MSSNDAISARLRGESVRLDGEWRITAMSSDLAACLENDVDASAMSLSDWPAIGSAEQLVVLMAPIRAGAPSVVMPAADGIGCISIVAEHDENGRVLRSWWQRSMMIGSAPKAAIPSNDTLMNDVASLLSHDGIAPLRRAIAFSDAALFADHNLPAVAQQRIESVRRELLDAADIVREIVATLRAPTHAVPGSSSTASIATAIDAYCADHGYATQFPSETGVSFAITPETIIPIFAAVTLLAAAFEGAPTWTRHERKWSLSVTCPLPVETCASLMRLGATVRDNANRLIRPRLAYARRLAQANGWEFAWNDQTLRVCGTCLTDRNTTSCQNQL
jgi:hypothetical protein